MTSSIRSAASRRSALLRRAAPLAATLVVAFAWAARAQEPAPAATPQAVPPPGDTPVPPAAAPPAPSAAAPATPAATQAAPAPATAAKKPAAQRPTPEEEIVVTATRSPQPILNVPAAVTVIRAADIERTPSKTADELLRIDPSFNMFRRSSSMAADPSSIGVKLRNVGTTAISRALVLVDGIPENDPFGGWVAWRSIPRIALERIEVVPGGGSSLYGNYALGGVIQALTRPIQPRDADVLAEYGSFNTAVVSARASDRIGAIGAGVDGEFLRSDGYTIAAPCPPLAPTVPNAPVESCRGAIDGPTPSEHATVRGRVEAQATKDLSFDLHGSYFWEDLNGGTEFTTSAMRRLELAGGAHYATEGFGSLDLTVFGHDGQFFQTRTRVTQQPRAAETKGGHQYVPTDDLGASLVWESRPLALAGTHALSVGGDGRWVKGTTHEQAFPPGGGTTLRDSGGKQQLFGVFAQDLWDITSAFGASAAVRYDHWENRDGSQILTSNAGAVTTTEYANRSGDEWSPKIGLRGRFAEWLNVRAAAYGSFRAPTLDELYRSFQVGTVVTASNPNLVPERLKGAEAGVDLGGPRGIGLRLTGFWNEIDNPIVNATVIDPVTGRPVPNARQRQNVGTGRVRGLEAEASVPFARHFTANAAYTLAQTRITDPGNQPQLDGKQFAQSPQNVATFSLVYDQPRLFTVNVQARYVGQQYEDDLNIQPLGVVWLFDAFAAWHATRRVDVYLAGENLLDKTYYVGRAGLDTIGQPLFVHGGVRIQAGM